MKDSENSMPEKKRIKEKCAALMLSQEFVRVCFLVEGAFDGFGTGEATVAFGEVAVPFVVELFAFVNPGSVSGR